MICLRCGHCCHEYLVAIVDDPKKGLQEDNIKAKEDGRCQHLEGDKPGEYSCSVHDESWYEETPCFAHTQIEFSNSPCRFGKHILERAHS
jgi:hypothetical protein